MLQTLARHAADADGEPVWPAASWQALRDGGVLRWVVPKEYAGDGLGIPDLLAGYEELAAACLTTCFLLSQREAAIRRIVDGENDALRRDLLPALAAGEQFATVGLSQLTTSRQHTAPALRASFDSNVLRLDGVIPWVTGAANADHLIVGAVIEDGRQVLTVLPRHATGVRVDPPLPLAALLGSMTTEVHCDGVQLERRWLLAGPSANVLSAARGGAGGLETSCLALGLTAAATRYLQAESAARPELTETSRRLDEARTRLREELHRLASGENTPERAAGLRARANTLVLQATQATLAAAKGSGFLRQHPAQRWARQALFFLIWSCPRPAAEATLAYLTATSHGVCS
jgi:alkylation response protein AidB-like acyl-CoA dehydrogenase